MAIASEPIRAEWKVSEVLARHPQLLQVLIDLTPAFGHLRNPLARTLRTRLVSVAQAARVAGMQPNELVRLLNEAAGLAVSDALAAAVVDESPAPPIIDMDITEDLDVRPLLARGEEPFQMIMAAVARVPESGALRLRTSFEPVPLYSVLARRGFSHSSKALAEDDWEVIFGRRGPEDVPPPGCARSNCQPSEATDSELVIRLDVSDLVPPEPMVRILETASKLRTDQTLLVEHHRRPVYLYPQLDAQGFAHETTELGPGRVQIVIRRA